MVVSVALTCIVLLPFWTRARFEIYQNQKIHINLITEFGSQFTKTHIPKLGILLSRLKTSCLKLSSLLAGVGYGLILSDFLITNCWVWMFKRRKKMPNEHFKVWIQWIYYLHYCINEKCNNSKCVHWHEQAHAAALLIGLVHRSGSHWWAHTWNRSWLTFHRSAFHSIENENKTHQINTNED